MMKMRALALGLAIGFVVAVAPSCSGNKCGPNNCGGCCDASGKCVAKPNNQNNVTCGSAGAACANCVTSGTVCDATTFKCGGAGTGGGTGGGTATGGGTGTGGGSACTTGCTLSNGNCAPGNTLNNCGLNGAACQACATGQVCTSGACTTPMSMKKIGDPCADDAECKTSLGQDAICKLMTSSGNGAYTGGYCTLRCQNASSCPSGSICVPLDPRYGEADTICWDSCSGGDPCRQPGYACYGIGSQNACWIAPLPKEDAGTPADKVGRACTADTQCQKPPDSNGICMTRDLNRNWADGYCSTSFCSSNAECSADAGALCITFDYGGSREPRCIARCGISTPIDGGTADCRQGYICGRYTVRSADGGEAASTDGICVPPVPPAPQRTGQACANDTECAVPTGTIADCLPATLPDAGPSGMPEGYCSRFGCGLDEECAADGGGICLGISQTDTACFQACPAGGAGQSTCRMGYICQPYGLGDGGSSTDGYCAARCDSAGAGCAQGRTCSADGYCR